MVLPAEDILAIQKVIADYCHAVDAGDGDAFVALFTEDASLDVGMGEPLVGHDAIRELGKTVSMMVPGVRHLVSNMSIEGDGDTASGRAYAQAFRTAGGPAETTLIASGIYHDTFRKEGGTWRFSERAVTNDV